MTKRTKLDTENIEEDAETLKRIARKRESGLTISTETNKIQNVASFRAADYIFKTRKQPKDAADTKHAKTKLVERFVLDAYRAGEWKSKRQAAKKLTSKAIQYAEELDAKVLQTDRAEQTIYEWILKATKNSTFARIRIRLRADRTQSAFFSSIMHSTAFHWSVDCKIYLLARNTFAPDKLRAILESACLHFGCGRKTGLIFRSS